MKAFPLDRPRLSNEHIMAALFVVLVFYQIPQWIENPIRVLNFMAVLTLGLILDTILSVRRDHSVKCGVSASITVGMIYALFPAIPFWGGLLGTVAALIVGKQLWGGMGKNIFNPAMVGVLLLSFIFPRNNILFSIDYVTGIAMLLSLSFIFIRPFASIGLMIGMLLSMSLNGSLGIANIFSTGMFFWACLVMTDPVTISYRPVIGGVGGFCVGLASSLLNGGFSVGTMALLILSLNGLSVAIDIMFPVKRKVESKKTHIKKPYRKVIQGVENSQLSQGNHLTIESCNSLNAESILEKIRSHDVSGLGGAAFPSHVKIQSAIDANEEKKFLIVNAVECDPGLVHDEWILKQYSEEIYKGIQVLGECISFSDVILATKDRSELNFQHVIKVMEVSDLYPSGAEKKLIQHVLGKELSAETIPAHKGILVFNVQTLYSIYEAVCLNKKADSKFITFANMPRKEAQILKVKIGSKVSELVNSVYTGEEMIFIGGGFMQARQAIENELIEKSTNFIAVSERPRYKEGNCSKCGICVERCPSGLEVYKIANLVDGGQDEQAQIYQPERCISCGICSYYCLAGKNLSSKVRRAKAFKVSMGLKQS